MQIRTVIDFNQIFSKYNKHWNRTADIIGVIHKGSYQSLGISLYFGEILLLFLPHSEGLQCIYYLRILRFTDSMDKPVIPISYSFEIYVIVGDSFCEVQQQFKKFILSLLYASLFVLHMPLLHNH